MNQKMATNCRITMATINTICRIIGIACQMSAGSWNMANAGEVSMNSLTI